jgi:hypothetical protein
MKLLLMLENDAHKFHLQPLEHLALTLFLSFTGNLWIRWLLPYSGAGAPSGRRCGNMAASGAEAALGDDNRRSR